MTPSRPRKGVTFAAVAAATFLALSACSGGGSAKIDNAPPQGPRAKLRATA